MQIVTRKKHGGRPPKLTEEQKDMVVNHYNHGTTQRAIAEEFNVSLSTVRAVLRERTKTE